MGISFTVVEMVGMGLREVWMCPIQDWYRGGRSLFCYAWLGHMKLCEQRELLLSSLGRVVGGRSHPRLLIFSKADRGKALSRPTSTHFKNRTEWGTPQFSKVMWGFGVSSAYQLPSQKFAEQFV